MPIKSINGEPIALNSAENVEGLTDFQSNFAITFTTTAGYYDGNSSHIASPSSTSQEVVTNFYKVNRNVKAVSYDLLYTSNVTMWLVVLVRFYSGAYQRFMLCNSEQGNHTSGTFQIPESVVEISFSYRTYGTATFAAFPKVDYQGLGFAGPSPYPEKLTPLQTVRAMSLPAASNAGRYDVIFQDTGLYYFDASNLANDAVVRITGVKEVGEAVVPKDYTKFVYVKAGKSASVSIEETGRRSIVVVHDAEGTALDMNIYYAGMHAAIFDNIRMSNAERRFGQLTTGSAHQGIRTGLDTFTSDRTRISTDLFRVAGTLTVSLSDYEYGKFGIRAFTEDGVLVHDTSWVDADTSWSFDGNVYACIVLAKVGNYAVSPSEFDTFGLTVTPDSFGYYDLPVTGRVIDEMSAGIAGNLARSSAAVMPTRWLYYYDHIFINKLGGNAIIPSESLFNVQTARRLGFNMIEANVCPTSDGNYIVTHGANSQSGQTFGKAFYHVDGNDIENTPISSVTLSWIKEKVRYVSTHDKYKVAPPTLQEFLRECRNNGLTVLLGLSYDPNVIEIANKIMGKDNYVAYQGVRELTSAPIVHYSSKATVDEIVEQCKSYGAPYMYSMANVLDFTDEQLTEIVDAVHDVGCWIGYAACYLNEGQNQRLRNLGFDFAASGWEIPEFEHGNLCDISADDDFSEFAHTGTVSDGVLTLAEDDTIRPAQEPSLQFLSGGSLHVVFKGHINVYMGEFIGNTFYSSGDDTRSIWISTYFLESAPTFYCKGASGGAEILSIQYKASRF